MEIKNIKIKKTEPTKEYFEISYEVGSKKITRDVSKSLDVVKILIYHKEKNALVLVKQFRPLVYINHPNLAVRYELCGGRVDKDKPLQEIAKEEILEECGYKVEKLEKITTFVTNSKMTLFYTEVDESMKVNSGGGLDDEAIELVFLPVQEAKDFIFDESKPNRPALAFSFCWFLSNKCNKF